MKISDFLRVDAIESDLGASSKPGVLRELVGLLLRVDPNLDPNIVVDVLDRREKLQSTGIGQGIAIPHGRTGLVSNVTACFGRSVAGVDFQSLDGQPTHLFFTILVPEDAQGVHLKVLARLSRLLKRNELRQRLMKGEDAAELFQILVDEDQLL
ncbi:MAG: PTS sugar transporter subunit IIA [Myxococcota bacterium]|nr:PTS sugar transporter subunit IIA [Myxococcota bacterium]